MLDLHDLEEYFWEEMHRHEKADKKTNKEQHKKNTKWWYMLQEGRKEIEHRELDDYNFDFNINWKVWRDEKLTNKAKLDKLKFELIAIKNQLLIINEIEDLVERKKDFIGEEISKITKEEEEKEEQKVKAEHQIILDLKEKERRKELDLSKLYKWNEIINKVGEVVGYWCETIRHQAFIYLFETDRPKNKCGIRYICEPNYDDYSWGKEKNWGYDRYDREGNNVELPRRFSFGCDRYFPDKEKAKEIFDMEYRDLIKQVMKIWGEEKPIREQIKKDKEIKDDLLELNALILCKDLFKKERE